jgi:hypothetical protein
MRRNRINVNRTKETQQQATQAINTIKRQQAERDEISTIND